MARRPGKDIRVSAEDALEFEPEPVRRRLIPATVWMLLALVLITLAGLGGFLFGDRLATLGSDDPREVPVVDAEPGPIKQRPKNPGGAEIPYRGYEINKRMKGEEAAPRVENLLPAPEKPQAPPTAKPQPSPPEPAPAPAAAPPPKVQAAVRRSAQAEPLLPAKPPAKLVEAPPAPAPAPSPPPAAAPPAAPAPAPAPVAKAPALKATPAPKAASPPPPPPPPPQSQGGPLQLVPKSKQQATAPTAPVPAEQKVTKPLEPVSPPVRTTGAPTARQLLAKRAVPRSATAVSQGWQVQLAASRAAKTARIEGERLKKKHTDVLGKLSVRVVRADLGAKGVFYRIRLGALADKNAARAVCNKLSKRGQGCLIVAPGK